MPFSVLASAGAFCGTAGARFLDEVNDQGLLPGGWSRGKYDVSRPQLLHPRTAEGDFTVQAEDSRLLDAA